MDAKDVAIIQVLERTAKLSSRAIAKQVGLPISTVHRRIQKLEREGVIIGYKAIIDYNKTDTSIAANILIQLSEGTSKNAGIARLKELSEVQQLVNIQGVHYDLTIHVRFRTLKELSNFTEDLKMKEWIERLHTLIVIEQII